MVFMERVLLKISYLGSNYHGWQVQPNGITVQQVLGEKLQQMYKQKVNLTGCSRTDAGVHASEFYCHYDTELHIDKGGIVKGLNSVLPKDIAVLSFDAKISSISDKEILPSETSTAVPTIILTILYKKPSALTETMILSPSRVTEHSEIVLTVSVTVLPEEEKPIKS